MAARHRELTAAQQQVVDHGTGRGRVVGRAGTGKTTALFARYLRLVRGVPASRVLVVCRTRALADRWRDDALVELRGGFDALPITTVAGLAFDLVRRHGANHDVRLLDRDEQWALVHRLLEQEEVTGQGRLLWPTLHEWLPRRAFVDEVADAVLAYEASFLGVEELRTHADAAAVLPRWDELASFTTRYQEALDERGAIDASLVVVRACELLRDPALAAAERDRFTHVLADDFETATFATNRLLTMLTGRDANVVVAGNPAAAIGSSTGASPRYLERLGPASGTTLDVTLDVPFRSLDEAPDVVVCRHPSIEPEAVAGELLAAAARGVAWGDMAVLVRSPSQHARSIARALQRHAIPVRPVAGALADEPVVQALVDLFRWSTDDDAAALDRLLTSPLAGLDPAEAREVRRDARRDEIPLAAHPRLAELAALKADVVERIPTHDPAAIAHHVFRTALAHLVGTSDPSDERALDALVAFLDGLDRFVDRHPDARLPEYLVLLEGPAFDADPWRVPTPATDDVVTIASIASAAGREWHTVVVAGCVEGRLPAIRGHVSFFDRELLGGPDVPSVAARRRRSLGEERALFEEVACTRATHRLVATAAPEPGVLVSRFVEQWPTREPVLPFGDTRPPAPLAPTESDVAVWPDGALRLSASRLTTYDDCPLKFAFEYALRARGESGIWADFGTLVHKVLAEFLDPARAGERSWERLVDVAEACWTDDVARYQPQREEARRDLFDILDAWWKAEAGDGRGPDVLAVEHRFEVAVGPHVVTGSIDRVDRAPGGDGIEIVDYKTGRNPASPDDVVDDIQLATYHLAASLDPALSVHGPATRLRLLYLRGMTEREQPVTEDHGDRTRVRILASADEILAERFDPSVEGDCDHCDFHRLCPLQDAGREVIGE